MRTNGRHCNYCITELSRTDRHAEVGLELAQCHVELQSSQVNLQAEITTTPRNRTCQDIILIHATRINLLVKDNLM